LKQFPFKSAQSQVGFLFIRCDLIPRPLGRKLIRLRSKLHLILEALPRGSSLNIILKLSSVKDGLAVVEQYANAEIPRPPALHSHFITNSYLILISKFFPSPVSIIFLNVLNSTSDLSTHQRQFLLC